jgi:hypothetical protein
MVDTRPEFTDAEAAAMKKDIYERKGCALQDELAKMTPTDMASSFKKMMHAPVPTDRPDPGVGLYEYESKSSALMNWLGYDSHKLYMRAGEISFSQTSISDLYSAEIDFKTGTGSSHCYDVTRIDRSTP